MEQLRHKFTAPMNDSSLLFFTFVRLYLVCKIEVNMTFSFKVKRLTLSIRYYVYMLPLKWMCLGKMDLELFVSLAIYLTQISDLPDLRIYLRQNRLA